METIDKNDIGKISGEIIFQRGGGRHACVILD